MPGMPEMLVILAVVVLLFGAKKIPELAKGMGKGIKSFKKEMADDSEDKPEEKIVDATSSEEKPQVKETTKEA